MGHGLRAVGVGKELKEEATEPTAMPFILAFTSMITEYDLILPRRDVHTAPIPDCIARIGIHRIVFHLGVELLDVSFRTFLCKE